MKHLPVAPLCSSDGIVFGSPCQAGCQEMCTGPNRTQLFTNCSLLTNSSAVLSSDQCPDSTLVHLIGFQYIFTVVRSLVITCPLISLFINLRCVVKKVRPLSLGLLTCLTTLISSFNADTFYAKHITGKK
ncbi:solute carrier organic anion transporter family member 4A1-like [Diaphorina citri]|uniref:Solute carrier organic anion transporter family member 4A1-like n=1 Tax=Diaphorina citri TaxID=121845 RepID=A0A3Q0J5I4_DIACI|nr:solute carrier organic anion transporter family member 4A1-like [Diaphorina citri]